MADSLVFQKPSKLAHISSCVCDTSNNNVHFSEIKLAIFEKVNQKGISQIYPLAYT
jgi:hypothetical protein